MTKYIQQAEVDRKRGMVRTIKLTLRSNRGVNF